MSTQIDLVIENVKKRSTAVKWALGLGTVFLAGPLLWTLFYALLGAAAVGAVTVLTGATILAAVNYFPVFTMKLANKKIEMIKAEAAANPIETFQNIYIENDNELKRVKAAIGEQATSVELYRQQVNRHESSFPEDVATIQQMKEELSQYVSLLELRELKFREAVERQVKFDRVIQTMKSRYAAATAGVKANKLSGQEHSDILQKIKAEAAYDAVMAKQAEAFSALRTAMLDAPIKSSSTPSLALTNQPPSNIVEMSVGSSSASVIPVNR